MRNFFGPFRVKKNEPIIIAEVGVNHGGNFALAKKYIEQCKKAGADAVKFQTYKAETIVSKNSPAYWDLKFEKSKSQYELFNKYDSLDYFHYKKLKKFCEQKKILFMTTLFSAKDVVVYNSLLKVYKISSSDITNVPLLKEIGKMKKYTILSTGAATIKEIKFALKILSLPKNKVCLMHCVLNYPTKDKIANLGYIKILQRFFKGYIIGYSDHTLIDQNLTALSLADDLGAQIIEKHFTLNKKLKGNDHYHAMDSNDLIKFKKLINKKNILRGNGKKNISFEKNSILYARRGIYAKKDIEKNAVFNEENLITLRPACGISAKYWNHIMGKKAKVKIEKNKNITKADILNIKF